MAKKDYSDIKYKYFLDTILFQVCKDDTVCF